MTFFFGEATNATQSCTKLHKAADGTGLSENECSVESSEKLDHSAPVEGADEQVESTLDVLGIVPQLLP